MSAAVAEYLESAEVRAEEILSRSQLRRGFGGVVLAFLIHGLVVSTWVSRIAAVKGALSLTDGALGLALLGAAVGSVGAIPVSGWLVTRYGSRRVCQWTTLGFCSALAPLALASNGAALVAALVYYGVMAGGHDVAINAQAVATEKRLGKPAISRFHAMFSIGGIAGAAAGAFIASRGVGTSAHLVIAAALLAGIAAWLPKLLLDEQTEAHAKHGRIRRIPLALAALSAIGFCIFLSEGAIADWTAVYLKQVLQSSDGLAPMGYAVFSAAMAVFRLSGDWIAGRIGRTATIRYGGLLAAAGLALVVAAHSTPFALAGFAAAGAGFSSIIPLVFAAGGRVEGVSEGAGIATVSGLGYLGFLVGPPAIGMISEFTSLRFGLGLLVVLSLTAAIMAGIVERKDSAT